MRRELRALRAESQRLRARLRRLEDRDKLARVAPVKSSVPKKMGAHPRRGEAEAPALPVIQLQGPGKRSAELGAVDDGGPPVVLRWTKGDPSSPQADLDMVPVDRSVLRRPDPVNRRASSKGRVAGGSVPRSADEERAVYRKALRTFRVDQNPAAAVLAFDRFLRRYPGSRLSDNAHYWRAEAHLAMGAAESALEGFEGLVRRFPRSDKRADALLGKGRALLRMGGEKRALKAFRGVVRRFPQSAAAESARAQMAALKAEG